MLARLAGEEPEPTPQPDDASPSTAAASNDPADHNRGGGGGGGDGKKGGATQARSRPSAGKGAAEEPEPEPQPDDASPSTAAASYDPADYQKPHPDDRGGGGKKGVATKPRGLAKVAPADKARGEDTDGSAKAKSPLSLDHCGNCGVESDELRKCKQCGVVAYCGEACQKVSHQRRRRASHCCAAPQR